MTRLLRAAAYGSAIALTVAGVVYATRSRPAPIASSAGGHDHTAMAMGTDAPRPVALSGADARRIGVTYAAAILGPLEREVRTMGQVVVDESRQRIITARVDGYVERLFVDRTGQYVRAGDPLLSLYAPMVQQAVEELRLAQRLDRDLATGGSADPAASLVEAARRRLAAWDIAAGDLEALTGDGATARTVPLRSSGSGVVLEKRVIAGQRIMAGETLYRLADLSTVWIEGDVFEQDLADVRIGQMVHADLQALPGDHRMGRIAFIAPTMDPDTRTSRIRVVLPNTDGVLKPGMYATLRITGTAQGDALTIPRDAVLSTGERNVVFVKQPDGRLAPREVALGTSNDTRIEILRGLAAGDTVVASATFLVDAESNLGKAMGGMGDMPGMDMSGPPAPLPMAPVKPAPPKAVPRATATPLTPPPAHEHHHQPPE